MAFLHESSSSEENIDVGVNNSIQDEEEGDLNDRDNITRVRRRNQTSTNRPTRTSPQTPNQAETPQAQTPHIVSTDEKMASLIQNCCIAGAAWFIVSVIVIVAMAIFLVNGSSNQQEFKCPDYHACRNDLKECKSQNKQERSHSNDQADKLLSRTDECSFIKTELSSCTTERLFSRIFISCIILIVVWYCCYPCWRAWRYPYAQQVVIAQRRHQYNY